MMSVELEQEKTPNDFVICELFSEKGLAVLNDCIQWKKIFEASEAKVATLENEIRKIKEAKEVLESKISSVHILMQGHLKDFPLTSETEGLFKNVLRVLDPNLDEFTTKVNSAQQTITPDTRDVLSSSVAAESALGVSNSGAQNCLDIPVTRIKRCQVSVENVVSQAKVRRNERPGSSTSDANEELDEDSSVTRIRIAVESFFKSLKNEILDEDTKAIIENLCVRLKCDPVALTLAASYINQDLSVVADPLKNIIENYIVKIKNENDIVRGDRKAPELVENPHYWTLRVTCEKIRETAEIGEKAMKVMEIISFLAADNIPTKFVFDLCDSMGNKENSAARENIFQLLKRFSVINSGLGELFSVHPLIQEAIRNDLEEQERITEILGRIQRGAHEMIKTNAISSEQMVHVKSIWDHVTKRADLIKEDGGFPGSICKRLVKLGKNREAIDFSCRVLPVLESTLTLGGKHRWIFAVMYWTGAALHRLGEYSKALALLSEVYENQKELFGEEDEDSVVTASEIGRVQWRLGKYDKALKMFRSALEKRERVFGKEHPGTLSLKNSIAVALSGQRKYEEALELYEQVLEVRERVSGKEHPSTLTTKQNVACVRYSQGKFEEALKMFQEVVQLQERVLEVNHLETLNTKEWIAYTYGSLGREDEAVEVYKEVLEKRQEILGPEHPETLDTKFNMATFKFSQENYQDALQLFQEVLKVQERVLELDHADTLRTKKWIADADKCLARKERRNFS